MKKTIITAALLFLAAAATQAEDVNITWTPPTSTAICEEGPPLDNLAGFKIYELVATINDPDETTFTIEGKKPGSYEYTATAFDSDGGVSMLAASVDRVVESFVATGPVYTVIKRDNRFVLLPVGTVPSGTACDPAQSVNGRYAVPIEAVSWSGTVRPVVVVADCQ